MNDIRRSVAIKLQNLMDEKNISQTELANQTGIAQATISNLLPGMDDEKQHPATSYENILALAKFFGVSVDWLLGISEHESIEENIRISAKTTGLSDQAVKRIIEWNRGDKLGSGKEAIQALELLLCEDEEGIILSDIFRFLFMDYSKIYLMHPDQPIMLSYKNKIALHTINSQDDLDYYFADLDILQYAAIDELKVSLVELRKYLEEKWAKDHSHDKKATKKRRP